MYSTLNYIVCCFPPPSLPASVLGQRGKIGRVAFWDKCTVPLRRNGESAIFYQFSI